ncbi:MAG TPA: FAD-dependent oxidoreductase [Deltaproteobacteria bacterium]|jgi:NADPH-dependent 2,4-dienoyl-CoA reductase/sulfur reductase-like enzyme|nr:FAD-dependent oxidoreductase [Deltaproteobacteria bacterium]OQC28180.1 MAG: Coenzyme A disulfide reductase [Deltaproteobacteria bacterium ADurb.Bin072]HNQ84645.1 FAD-dependent oxidoreductase [Deltaproteobacteria bacterium]HNS88525.1 FAD-dependent oxidoreductase [Deltaproteobacteria bacterium]HOA43429.1 FAD-dependent oxidoreductase [Deltaproteobacteria bacterium]
MRVIVIGGDAAGMSAASQVKRQRPEYEVIVFERGEYISYAACGVPYYVGGAVAGLDDLVEVSPEEAREKRRVDLRLRHTVVAIDPSKRTVTVEHDGAQAVEPYDRLLIATGARAQSMGIDVGAYPNVFTMNDLYDAARIREFLVDRKPRSVAVIGGGYIGLEACESFRQQGVETTLVHRREDLHRSFEKELSDIIKEKLTEQGVSLSLGRPFSGLEQRGDRIGIVRDVDVLEFDAVLLAVGVEPNSDLAKAAGVELGASRAIRVNEFMETSVAGIYAAGDCATARLTTFGLEVHAPLALKANKQGLIAGMNIAGGREAFAGVLNTAITKVFDLGVARTGLSFDQAVELGLDPEKVVVTSRDRARYYPGAMPMTSLVIIGRKDRRVLGAQLSGRIESVKRIDVYVCALSNRMTIDQVFDLDLAYAPPFSPVYDPVLLAARVARKKK